MVSASLQGFANVYSLFAFKLYFSFCLIHVGLKLLVIKFTIRIFSCKFEQNARKTLILRENTATNKSIAWLLQNVSSKIFISYEPPCRFSRMFIFFSYFWHFTPSYIIHFGLKMFIIKLSVRTCSYELEQNSKITFI